MLCPGCGGVLNEGATLKTINREEYGCALCAAGYKPTLDEMVEVTFTVSPRVRRIAAHDPDSRRASARPSPCFQQAQAAGRDDRIAAGAVAAVAREPHRSPRHSGAMDCRRPAPRSARQTQAFLERGNDDLLLKIGIHVGPCLAVKLNDSRDYFGQTVNMAARIQGLASSRAIVATKPSSREFSRPRNSPSPTRRWSIRFRDLRVG